MSIHIKQTNPSLLISQSSTVQQLYAKFQNLKQRITNTDSKRSSRSTQRKHIVQCKQRDNKHRKIGMIQPLPLSVYIGIRNQTKMEKNQNVSNVNDKINWQLETKVMTERLTTMIYQIQQRYTDILSQLTRKLLSLSNKLQIAQEIIRQRRIQDKLIKLNSSFTQNPNNTTRCHTFKSLSQNTIENSLLNLSKNKQTVINKQFLVYQRETTQQQQNRIEKETIHKQQIKQLVHKNQNRISKILQKSQYQNINQSFNNKHDDDVDIKSLNRRKQLIALNNKQISITITKPQQLSTSISSPLTLQQSLIQKQKFITQLQIQNKKLNKMIQQSKLNFQHNFQLNQILKHQNKILQQTLINLEKQKKLSQIQTKSLTIQIETLTIQIKRLNVQLKTLRQDHQLKTVQINQIFYNNNNLHNQTKQSNQTGSSDTININQHTTLSQKKNNKNTIQKQQQQHLNEPLYELQTLTDRSEILDYVKQQQQQKESTQIIQLQLSQLQTVKHSQSLVLLNRLTIVGSGIDGMVINKKKQKQLVDEIHLLEQQNKLLKQKKDKFQQEISKAENDEDMMQEQLSRLNQQIRRLNTLYYTIEQLAVKLFKGEQLKQDKIALLQKQCKLRQEFYKKKQTKKRGFSLRR